MEIANHIAGRYVYTVNEVQFGVSKVWNDRMNISDLSN